MAATGFVFHPLCADHLTGPEHVEKPERILAVARRIRESGLAQEVQRHEPTPAGEDEIARVHPESHIRQVQEACATGDVLVSDPDTVISPGSYRAALLAAGGALQAADQVMSGAWKNAFVACRPPGHHAEKTHAMGFCLFNSAAVTAAALRQRHGLQRVAVVDWDVHHGNGTQHIFEADPTVFYASLHQWPLYPGTGAAWEQGTGQGTGTTLNCPMDPGTGDDAWVSAFEETVLPALEKFRPQFLILSAGFDAHAADPLSATQVSVNGYRRMTRLAAGLMAQVGQGRMVSLLEGGYDLKALADSVEAHVAELVEAPDATPEAPGT